MHFRAFPRKEANSVEEGPRPFGRRTNFGQMVRDRLTTSRIFKALALGLGLGVLSLLLAPT